MRVEQHTHDFRSLALRAVALTSELENTLAAARLLRFEMLTHAKALRRVSSPIPEGAGKAELAENADAYERSVRNLNAWRKQ